MQKKQLALLLNAKDNVATLLSDSSKSDTIVLKGSDIEITASAPVPYGHKVAVEPIENGKNILKYGMCIGKATKDIETGDWVHVHNMASAFDIDFNKRLDKR